MLFVLQNIISVHLFVHDNPYKRTISKVVKAIKKNTSNSLSKKT